VIEIIGIEGSDEYRAAMVLAERLAKQWPGVDTSPKSEDDIIISSNVKLSGYKVSDVDVVLLGAFGRPRYFVPTRILKGVNGESLFGLKVRVDNLLVAIEVKGQDAGGVNISADEVIVRYADGWKSATQQNITQLHALAGYFDDQHVDAWVYRCVFLQGIGKLPVSGTGPRPASGAITLESSGAEFLTSIAAVNELRVVGKEHTLRSFKREAAEKVAAAPIFRRIVPSRLDRLKMDRISARPAEARRLAAELGKSRLHIRGHGGTGKTILMLQAAHLAYEQFGKRCLILTYNVALAADIQRSLGLLGIPGRSEGGGVEVRTSMSFLFEWLKLLGVTNGQDSSYEELAELCSEALKLLDGGGLSRADVEGVLAGSGADIAFDAIIVDEAQDWPQVEAELLCRLYGPEKVSVADGIDQLVRGSPTNWKRTLPAETKSDDRSLVKCLRMKRNLGVFANAVASAAGLAWEVEPNEQAAGGNIILVKGSFTGRRDIRDELLESATGSKNEKIDFLYCVPPGDVRKTDQGATSALSTFLREDGTEVWDGVDVTVRKSFPRSTGTYRVIQYDSCRGLEGWTVVLEGFDEFWWLKRDAALRAARDDASFRGRTPESRAALAAWRWSMIPFTRPLDTLVIALRDWEGEPATLLRRIAGEHNDFISIE